VGGFLRHGLAGLLHLDGTTFRTVRDLVVRPGKLTADFLGGHRVRYLQPVQVYLIAAALFFLVNSFHPFMVVDAESLDVRSALGIMAARGSIGPATLEALAARGISPGLFAERFRTVAGNLLPVFLLAVVVLFGLAVAAAHPRGGRPLLSAAVFALHWTGFYLLLMILERLPGGAPGSRPVVSGVLTLAAGFHLTLALRRVYGGRWLLTIVRAAGLFLVFNAFLAEWAAAVIAYAFHRI